MKLKHGVIHREGLVLHVAQWSSVICLLPPGLLTLQTTVCAFSHLLGSEVHAADVQSSERLVAVVWFAGMLGFGAALTSGQ